MPERRPYRRPEAGKARELRREWVALSECDLCVWELSTPEMLQLAERSARPAIDPRGGVNDSAATAWLVALSTRHGDAADSPRVWDDLSLDEALSLRWGDTQKLVAAIKRVCGLDPGEIRELQDFTGATGAPKPSGSSSSASSSSTGSRRKSTSRTTS